MHKRDTILHTKIKTRVAPQRTVALKESLHWWLWAHQHCRHGQLAGARLLAGNSRRSERTREAAPSQIDVLLMRSLCVSVAVHVRWQVGISRELHMVRASREGAHCVDALVAFVVCTFDQRESAWVATCIACLLKHKRNDKISHPNEGKGTTKLKKKKR